MKCKLLQIAFAAAAVAAGAVDGLAEQKVVITALDGNVSKINIADISRITFDGAEMTVATANGNSVFNVADVDNIAFDLSTSAAEEISTRLDDIDIKVSGGVLTVAGPQGKLLKVSVYDLKGVAVGQSVGTETVSVDFNTMPAGIYIVRANDKTIKIIR